MIKTAVITGAAGGIGRELSLTHLHQGDRVIMVDINADALSAFEAEFLPQYPNQLITFACDITCPEAIHRLVMTIEQHDLPIHWLYNNAGIIGAIAPLWELETQQIQNVIDVNLTGMVHLTKALLPLLFKQEFTSRIVNIASLYSVCSGSQLTPYTMTKHAVLAFSESLQLDLARLDKPVQLSVVFPSFTATGLLGNSPKTQNPAFHEALEQLIERARPAQEVAEHIVQEVNKGQFYIFPDKEVKSYCEERAEAMIHQEAPYQSAIERLLTALQRRVAKSRSKSSV